MENPRPLASNILIRIDDFNPDRRIDVIATLATCGEFIQDGNTGKSPTNKREAQGSPSDSNAQAFAIMKDKLGNFGEGR
jgi:hypothetical protein